LKYKFRKQLKFEFGLNFKGVQIFEEKFHNFTKKSFMSADPLEEIDIGDGVTPRPTFINKNLCADYKSNLVGLLREYVDCFA
jgi:hypothetical protein